jgi:hypothetical protein
MQNGAISADEAGVKAHQMALQYAQEHNLEGGPYSLIHPGAHLEISPDGKLVAITGDDNLGYLHENVGSDAQEHVSGGAEHGAAQVVSEHPAETSAGGSGEFALDEQTAKAIDGYNTQIHEISDNLGKMHGDLTELDRKITLVSSGQYEEATSFMQFGPERTLIDLTDQKQLLEKAISVAESNRDGLLDKIHNGYFGRLSADIFGSKQEFMKISGTRASDVLRDNVKAHKLFDRIMGSNDTNLAALKQAVGSINTEKESFGLWVLRVSKEMSRLGIKKI